MSSSITFKKVFAYLGKYLFLKWFNQANITGDFKKILKNKLLTDLKNNLVIFLTYKIDSSEG